MTPLETVTVLITDLVGSTGLESRIGPGAADELRDEHFALLRAAIEEDAGREVKNTGDGLIAAFDSASDAVACAVAVQQRFERRNRSAEEQLLIKVGISLGDATASDGDYFGMPVIEAARLCDRAQGGQILAKEIVAHLGGARHSGSLKSVGDLDLKGIPQAVPTVEVGWEPLGEEGPSLPLPPRLQEMPPGGFVGRSAERARLAELIGDAIDGSRRLALISGEPGIGKTRLATHAAFEARSHGALVLYGRCDEELAVPYGPWIEALTHYVEHAPDQVLRAHVERHGGELTRLVPELSARGSNVPAPRETDAETERYLLWGAVVGLLQEASSAEPLALVLDDLHWADKPTLQLLKHAVAQGQGMRVLMLGTYRESDLARGHPLSDALADLRREQGVERIALKGLGEQDIVEIMERAAGHELDDAGLGLAGQLVRETDGNPFYTGELLRHLLESGGVYQQDGGHWTVRGELSELGLPESVREVLGRRIERLGEETRTALSTAAVIGRDFDVDLLLRVGDHSEEELLELLEEAVGASVLIESATVTGRFSFAHALINHTLYEDLGNTRRARLHRRIAEALEQLLGPEPGARVSELAHHWTKATTAVDLEKAVTYARMAGERALQELAPEEALRWFGQALELQGQDGEAESDERCRLLIGLGEAQRLTGDPAHRETLLEAARAASKLKDAELAARAALANHRGTVGSGTYGEIDQERIDAIVRALELDDPPDLPRRARLLALQTQELSWDLDFARRRTLAEEAISLARTAGDGGRALADTLQSVALGIWSAETLEVRSAFAHELRGLAVELGDPAVESGALELTCHTSAERGEFEQAVAANERSRAIARELGQPSLRWVTIGESAGLELLRGHLAAGERLAEQALRIGQESDPTAAVQTYGGQLLFMRRAQGRVNEVIELQEKAVSAQPGIVAWRAGLAASLCCLDRHDEANTILDDAESDGFEHVSPSTTMLATLALYADAASRAHNAKPAARLYERMEPFCEQVIWLGIMGYGHTQLWLGLLAELMGDRERSDEHLGFACRFHEGNDVPLWAARGHLGWAEALARRGDVRGAREHAKRALDLSREHGYGLFEPRAATLVETESAAGA
jgi:class 3 adenylate cyclase/tetratricopeptide (TPR) repeat protein